ncbi:MAG: LpxL/LpxP family Kdo(2)-lipid IV(A) lauroyl/palmitoleoyl acyltransferase [Xanthomonadaceae bacterium]|nr:LpxL/LpxP family Kdo(2)-lipid IV(A) lauroyl/palmitoleoyl acyltransferase [Xanthomonadaceae bacterium]
MPARAYSPRYWPTWLAMGLLWCLARLPFPLATRVGLGLGRLLYPLIRERRKIVLRNLELCFPELDRKRREQLAKRNFAYTGKAFAEIAHAWWGNHDKLAGRCEVRGIEHLREAQAQGHGVILLSAHFTCLEIVAPLASAVAPCYVIYRPQRNPVIEYCMRSARDRNTLGAIPRNDVRAILKALRKGHSVWYAADQDMGRRRSVFAPFFGIETATVNALTRLVKISKAPVVPVFFHGKPDHSGYVAEFFPILREIPGPDEVSDAAVVNRAIEEAVRRHPEQYFWVHRRFKTRPDPDEPSPYRD